MGRALSGVLAGAIVAFVVIVLVEMVSLWLFPLPPGIDPNDKAAIAAAIPSMPIGAFLLVMLAWVLGAGLGALTALRVARSTARWPGRAVGALVLVGALYNLMVIPHPVWFAPSAVLAIIAATYLATRAQPAPAE